MQLEELLKKAAPRPWEEGATTHIYVDIPPNFPPFEAISISNGAKGPQIALIPLDESSRENAVLILRAVNSFEPWLATFAAIADKLHHAVNGGLKGTGHRERIGDFKIVMRECRDIARGAIHQAEEV